jgi:hypothetical protein
MPRYSGMRLAINYGPPADTTPPSFLTGTSGSVNENVQLSFTITTDELCTIAITGGADAAQFELATTSLAFSHVLRWVGNGVKLHGAPADSDLNNTYVVQVTATDQSGNNQTSQTITITVNEVSAGQSLGLLLALTRA